MLLTVVMSVLNGERYLEAAVDSILNQEFSDFEFLIVDNASTDSTPTILARFSKSDHRIKIIKNQNTLPLVSSRHMAIEKARGDWVALMDADDICEPSRLKRQVEVITQHGDNLGAVGTWARYINADGDFLGNMTMEPTTFDKFEEMYKSDEAIALVDPSSVIHRSTFLEIGGYRPEYTPAGDIDLWYRIAETGKKIIVIPDFLMRYRIHSGAGSVQKTMLQRHRTHFINYNMRRRRTGQDEISLETFEQEVWSRPAYRLPRLRNDWAMSLYKRAGLSYGERKLIPFVTNLVGAALVKPSFVAKRLINQKLKRRNGSEQ